MAVQFDVVFKKTDQSFPVEFKDFQGVTVIGEADPYKGDYEVIPLTVEQVLPTSGKLMSADIKVGPIPKQYGLVTYNQDKTIKIT